ncbi:MAG: hypothetical protein ACOVO2_05955 [Emticicia sp.]|uniref:hypothetical protein n=1 Tax=Emticicia sp. TaxID=1930953 RepID=UPI003BA4BF6D
MNKYVFLFLIFVSGFSHAQNYPASGVLKTIEIEVTGNPTWQKIIPLGSDGLLLFVKKDVTKALLIKFDTDLKKLWETEVLLDVERKPTAYSFDSQKVTFLFSENQGMYYQLYSFDLQSGKVENNGFELREYFQDQNYLNFQNRILIAGINEKGGAFYDFDFKTNEGQFISAELNGKAQLQQIKLNQKTNLVETLWAIKEPGYTNEKKKKGEFIKNAYVVFAKYDTLGKLISKTAIQSNAGNFPLTGQLTFIDSLTYAVTGIYQSNTGIKGVYYSKIERDKTILTKFYDYRKFLVGSENLKDEQLKKLLNTYSFLPTQTVFTENQILVGGSFYQPSYQIVSVDNPDFVGYDINSYNSTQRTRTKQVLSGYIYSNGFTASFDLSGNLLKQQSIDIVQTSSNLDEVLAINKQNAAAICVKGNLIVTKPKSFSESKIYKLSTENDDPKNNQYIAKYRSVRNWYENYFIADGSRIKFEVIKEMSSSKEKPSRRKKQQRQIPETNVKKIIYLSKVLNSSF